MSPESPAQTAPSFPRRDSPRFWLRQVAIGAVVLVLAILATSAYLRQSALQAACTDPPQCSASAVAGNALRAPSTGVSVARIIHRLSASAVGAAILLMAFLVWVQTPRARVEVAASAALLALVLLLAALGRFSSAPSPAVTFGNLAGGMALLGLLHWMWLRSATAVVTTRFPPSALWMAGAIAAAVFEIALGSLLSASRVGPASPLPPVPALTFAHAATGLVLLGLAAVATLHPAARRNKARLPGMLALMLAVALAVTGWICGQPEAPVAIAVAHNLFAAGLMMALVTAAHRLRVQG